MDEKKDVKDTEKTSNKDLTEKENTKTDTKISKSEDINTNVDITEKENAKPKEKGENKEKKVNKKLIIIIVCVALFVLLVLSTIFAIFNINNSKIINRVSINGLDVSNMSSEEAKSKLENIYKEKISKEIGLVYKEFKGSVNPANIETAYDIENAVNEAVNIGKNSNIFVNNFNILKTYLFGNNVILNMTINETALSQALDDINTKLPGVVVESNYYQEDTNLIVKKGTPGISMDKENLISSIRDELLSIDTNNNTLEIPVVDKTPNPIDAQKIHDEIYTEVQDAYYTKDPFEIHPEVYGVDFDVENAKTILSEEKDEYVIPLVITEPKVTIDQIGTEAFPDQLSIFTTKYDGGNVDRTTNLRLACQKLNGKVILAGETFSYNKTLGERTVANGYKNGKIYENGEVVDGIGGGICQISSTLYNAVLMANMEIVERRNHMFVTSYLPAGRDATVSYGTTDFRFKNTRKYPVRLVANVNNGIATVAVYGIKEDDDPTVSFSTKTVSTIPFSTQYVEDNSLAAGEEQVKQNGTDGLVTETYITKTLNGKTISSKLLSRDTYSAMNKIILKGVSAGGISPSTPVTPQPVTPSTPETNTTTNNTTNTTPSSGDTNNTTNTSTNSNENSNNTI